MRLKRWISGGLLVGLLVMVLTGVAALGASGGSDGGGESQPAVVEDLVDDHELIEELLAVEAVGDNRGLFAKVAEILGVDAGATAEAFERVDAEVEAAYTNALIDALVESGHISRNDGDALRKQVQEGDYTGLDQLWADSIDEQCWLSVPMNESLPLDEESAEEQPRSEEAEPCSPATWYDDAVEVALQQIPDEEEYFARIGALLEVDGDAVAEALDTALSELHPCDAGQCDTVEETTR